MYVLGSYLSRYFRYVGRYTRVGRYVCMYIHRTVPPWCWLFRFLQGCVLSALSVINYLSTLRRYLVRAGKKKMIGWSGMQLRGSSEESLRVLWGIYRVSLRVSWGEGSLGNFKKNKKIKK